MVSLSNTQDWTVRQDLAHDRFRSGQTPSIVAHNQPSNVRQLNISQSVAAKVECRWAVEQNTEFLISAASDFHVEQLRLPNVDRVEICQEFDASKKDELAFNCIAAFHSTNHNQDWDTQIRAWLTNLHTGESTTLLTRSIDSAAKIRRTSSRVVETIQHRISQSGRYELRIYQQLKGSGDLAKFQLWVHDAHVIGYNNTRPRDLLSISSLGTSKPNVDTFKH